MLKLSSDKCIESEQFQCNKQSRSNIYYRDDASQPFYGIPLRFPTFGPRPHLTETHCLVPPRDFGVIIKWFGRYKLPTTYLLRYLDK